MKERGQELPPILFESVVELAKETTLRSGGHIPTLVIDALPHPIILQIPQLAPTHELRLEQMFIAGTALAEQATISRLRQVIWICEGWMSETEAGKLPEVPPRVIRGERKCWSLPDTKRAPAGLKRRFGRWFGMKQVCCENFETLAMAGETREKGIALS